MKRFIVLCLLLTSCSASAVQDNSSFAAAQPPRSANLATEGNQNSGNEMRVLAEVQVQLPAAEAPKLSWERIFFRPIIEREKTSNLKRLRSKQLPEDDLELRVWQGFGITTLQGFILKRNSGKWSALDLDWEVFEGRKRDRDLRPVDRKLGAPKSGWDAAWQRLVDAGILVLPGAEATDCSGNMHDGFSFVVEYKLQSKYRTYMYDNPDNAKCDEAKQMVEIKRIIDEEFYKRDFKVGVHSE